MESKYMEKLFLYTVYAFVAIGFVMVMLVGWDFTHGG